MKSLTRPGAAVVIAVAALLLHAAAHANCYAVYKGEARVYHGQTPPVDTSLPYSETVPARFGAGATMIVASGAFDCPRESELQGGDALPGSARQEADVVAREKALRYLAERHSMRSDDDDTTDGSTTGSYGGGTSTRGPIQTGPRGGRYYLNSSGNKTYVSSGGGRRR